MTVSEIKSRFSLQDEIASRGIEIGRGGFCRCPFHQGDNTASFKVYPDQNTWHCYGCGQGGDIIDFVRLMDGLSFIDACKAISGEGITATRKWSAEQFRRRKQAEERKKAADAQRGRELRSEICKYWMYLKVDEPFSDEWAEDYNRWQLLTYQESILSEREMREA